MTKSPDTRLFTATLAALDLPETDGVPEWVHLLPIDGEIRTFDGRGPFRVADAEAVIAASLFADPREANGLIVDENHASELAAGKGGPSPSRGKIKAMEVRAGGIWGHVAWNAAGRALLADQSYRGISPVIIHDAEYRVLRIKNAALVNYPNLRGLTALNQEQSMDLTKLAEALGLPVTATINEMVAAAAKLQGSGQSEVEVQAAMAEIATALGVCGTDRAAIVAAAQARNTAPPAEIAALQAELTTVASQLSALQSEGAKAKATAFVDGEITRGRVGVKPLRDHYIAMHMQDAARVEKEIGALPVLGGGNQATAGPPANGGEITALNAEQITAANRLGLGHDAYLATLKAERANEEQNR